MLHVGDATYNGGIENDCTKIPTDDDVKLPHSLVVSAKFAAVSGQVWIVKGITDATFLICWTFQALVVRQDELSGKCLSAY